MSRQTETLVFVVAALFAARHGVAMIRGKFHEARTPQYKERVLRFLLARNGSCHLSDLAQEMGLPEWVLRSCLFEMEEHDELITTYPARDRKTRIVQWTVHGIALLEGRPNALKLQA